MRRAMVEPFRYEKPLDKSLLKYGFNIPVELDIVKAFEPRLS